MESFLFLFQFVVISGHFGWLFILIRLLTVFTFSFVVVQLLRRVWFFVTLWTAAHQAFTISRSLLRLMSIELMMPSNHLILCCPLLLLPSTFPSIRVFSNESALRIRWPKYWSFSINPSNEYSEFISFRIDWFDLLAVQVTLVVFSSTTIWKRNFLSLSLLYGPTLNICTWLLEKS